MKLKAKRFLEGKLTREPGDTKKGRDESYPVGTVFECSSEEEAERLIEMGAAEPADGSVEDAAAYIEDAEDPESVEESIEEIEEAEDPVEGEADETGSDRTGPPGFDDITRNDILEELGKRIEPDSTLKRATKDVLYEKLVEVWE